MGKVNRRKLRNVRSMEISDNKIAKYILDLENKFEYNDTEIDDLLIEEECIRKDNSENEIVLQNKVHSIRKKIEELENENKKLDLEINKLYLKCEECKWWNYFEYPENCFKTNKHCPYLQKIKITKWM